MRILLIDLLRIDSNLPRLIFRAKVQKNEELIPEHLRNPLVLPRHVRVNTLKANTDAVLQRFLNEDQARGSTLNIEGKAKAIRFEEGNSTTKGKEKMAEGEGEGKASGEDTQSSQGALQHPSRDEHIPDLLVLPPSTDLHSHPLLEVRFPFFPLSRIELC